MIENNKIKYPIKLKRNNRETSKYKKLRKLKKGI